MEFDDSEDIWDWRLSDWKMASLRHLRTAKNTLESAISQNGTDVSRDMQSRNHPTMSNGKLRTPKTQGRKGLPVKEVHSSTIGSLASMAKGWVSCTRSHDPKIRIKMISWRRESPACIQGLTVQTVQLISYLKDLGGIGRPHLVASDRFLERTQKQSTYGHCRVFRYESRSGTAASGTLNI